MRKIIAYGLWGTISRYTRGAIENARIAQVVYPGWTCRFYLGASVPAEVTAELRAQPNVETLEVDEPEDLRATFWRFRAARDADILLCRDADSRLSRPEAEAVEAWLASDKEAHAFVFNRPRFDHSFNLLAGLFGVRGQALQDLWRETSKYSPNGIYSDDEIFLHKRLQPLLVQRNALLVHDHIWGWGESPPAPFTKDVFGVGWLHEPELWLQPFPLLRGSNYFTGLTAPPKTGRLWRALGRGLRRLHPGLGRRLGMMGVVRGPGWLERRLRSLTRGPYLGIPAPEDSRKIRQGMASIPSPFHGTIAFALPSNDAPLLRGALDNARAAAAFYPEWQCRFHVHPALDAQTRQELESMPGVQVREVDADVQKLDPSLWGLRDAGDCDVLLLRSPLARLSLYDRQAVYRWLASVCELHSLHDHPRHGWRRPTASLAGLRGAARAWAMAHPGHPDPLGALAQQAAEGRIDWLRHDNIWHVGTPLPWPVVPPMVAYHGMPWELSEEYAGLPTPALEDYRKREAYWEGMRFLATTIASKALRFLGWKPRRAERLMALLCSLLYPGRGSAAG